MTASIRTAIAFLVFAMGVSFSQEPEPEPLEADEVAKIETAKLKQLVESAQDRIEVTPNLDGAAVEEIKLEKADRPGERHVVLKGRVRHPQQCHIIGKIVKEAMQSNTFWSTLEDEFSMSVDKLSVVEPSLERGSKHLSLGIEDFLNNKFAAAEQHFANALVDCRDRDVVNLWKAAAEIALGQSDRAERRLSVMYEARRVSSDTFAVSLQRLQGPRRKALHDLEQKVMLKSPTGTNVK